MNKQRYFSAKLFSQNTSNYIKRTINDQLDHVINSENIDTAKSLRFFKDNVELFMRVFATRFNKENDDNCDKIITNLFFKLIEIEVDKLVFSDIDLILFFSNIRKQ